MILWYRHPLTLSRIFTGHESPYDSDDGRGGEGRGGRLGGGSRGDDRRPQNSGRGDYDEYDGRGGGGDGRSARNGGGGGIGGMGGSEQPAEYAEVELKSCPVSIPRHECVFKVSVEVYLDPFLLIYLLSLTIFYVLFTCTFTKLDTRYPLPIT